MGGVRVFFDGGFDGLLGDGAGVAEVDQGGEGVVAGGAVVGATGGGGDGYGEVVEFVFEFEDYALGGFFADAGDAGEGGVVAGADGGDEAAESMPLSTVMASLGPMPEMVRSFSKRRFSWVSEKPKRAIWSSRTWVWMRRAASAPSLGRAEKVATLMVTS